MMFLVLPKLRRLGERNDNDGNAAANELRFPSLHLTEVVLARKSGQMSQKNEERVVSEIIAYGDGAAAQVIKTQGVDADLFH
jgi:Asp-tRNA(Asn)/Glu-tRNA(Gln) amidotransferase B subunit